MAKRKAEREATESDSTASETPITPPSQTCSRSALPASTSIGIQPPSTSAMYTREDVVTLLVGAEKEEFVVHGHCLASSEFFTSALKKEWKEGQTRLIELPEASIKIVTHYLDYAYKGLLFSHAIQRGNHLKGSDAQHVLSRLYVFGERLLDNSLRNAIVKEQLRLMTLEDDDQNCTWYPSWNSAEVVYEGTPANSPMRRFLVDVLVSYGNQDWLDDHDIPSCPELLADVVREFTKKAEKIESPSDFRDKVLKAEDYFV